jgi:hypothetical protein
MGAWCLVAFGALCAAKSGIKESKKNKWGEN